MSIVTPFELWSILAIFMTSGITEKKVKTAYFKHVLHHVDVI